MLHSFVGPLWDSPLSPSGVGGVVGPKPFLVSWHVLSTHHKTAVQTADHSMPISKRPLLVPLKTTLPLLPWLLFVTFRLEWGYQ